MNKALQIGIIGAGPAGLYFALLMKKHNPAHQITLIEQNPAGATYGWGVVFSGRALGFLRDTDPDSYAQIEAQMEVWDDLTIARENENVRIDGSRYSGIARLTLLTILQEHCRKWGVDLRFQQRLPDLTAFADYDLVVGADGVNSVTRRQFADLFQTQASQLSNKYIWYGTTRVFDTLSLIFRSHQGGSYVAHCYRYSPTHSTFIVECDAQTWQRAGFAHMDEAESRQTCEEIFRDDLAGQPLLTNKSAWLNFNVVTNEYWSQGNTVLVGDALRTVHFSIGSGTRMALEDAIALYNACLVAPDVPRALSVFERTHRPNVEKMLEIARNSYDWYETFDQKMHLQAIPLAYDYMMRSSRIDFETLRNRAPRFAAQYESYEQNADSKLTSH